MLNISQVIPVRTDSNLCRKELTVYWSAPNSLIRSYLPSCINTIWGDESEAVAPIIWLYQTVDALKEEIFFPDLLITLRRHGMSQYQSTNYVQYHYVIRTKLLSKNVYVRWYILQSHIFENFSVVGTWVISSQHIEVRTKCPQDCFGLKFFKFYSNCTDISAQWSN